MCGERQRETERDRQTDRDKEVGGGTGVNGNYREWGFKGRVEC